jgi:DNA-binding XRE family transcriptional regulator
MENDGFRLKRIIEGEMGLKEYFDKTGISKTAAYHQFKKNLVKRDVVRKYLEPINIPVSKFYENVNPTPPLVANDSQTVYETKKNDGELLYNYLQGNGINITAFAKKMEVSKQTVYNWFQETQLPLGTMLQAAKVLNITLSTLRGDNSEKGFEKEIYNELQSINNKLDELIKRTN